MAENSISPKQQKAITALLSAPTIGAAAKTAGVGERTLYTWLASDETFLKALRDAQDRAVYGAVSRLAGAATEAAHTLASIASDPNEKSQVRVSAAKAVLDGALRLLELRDLAERIRVLEEKADARKL